MKKKILSFMMAICFIVPCAILLTACDDGAGSDALAYTYQSDTNTYVVSSCNEDATSVEIPALYKGENGELPVSGIGDNAFKNCAKVVSISVPISVISIGQGAFMGCSSLEQVNIPEGVTELRFKTFTGCASLKTVVLPSTLTEIYGGGDGSQDGAFKNCTGLETITIPNNVGRIEPYTFEGCTNLKTVILPERVTENGYIYINSDAFSNCTALQSIRIPEGTTGLLSYSFYGCSNLETVIIPASINNKKRFSEDAFIDCDKLTKIFYSGDSDTWNQIGGPYLGIKTYFYSETEPTISGDFWHYASDNITPEIWN